MSVEVGACCIHLWETGRNSDVRIGLPDNTNVKRVKIGTPVVYCSLCTHKCTEVFVVEHPTYSVPYIKPNTALVLIDGVIQECPKPIFRPKEDREL